jgi:hypothetical protein
MTTEQSTGNPRRVGEILRVISDAAKAFAEVDDEDGKSLASARGSFLLADFWLGMNERAPVRQS